MKRDRSLREKTGSSSEGARIFFASERETASETEILIGNPPPKLQGRAVELANLG